MERDRDEPESRIADARCAIDSFRESGAQIGCIAMSAGRNYYLEGRVRFSTLAILFSLFIGPVSGAQTQESRRVPSTPEKVIIDTDIGDDIDDAFALALALRSPELEILGITTAFGATELRARLVDRYLQAVGRGDIPIAAGIPTQHTNNVFTQAAYAQ